MLLKISMPGQFQFRMIQDWKSVFFHRGGDIHYIGGAEILPPPLEPGEEAACIEKLGGEQNEKARNTLVEHNLRLVVYIAKKFDNTGVGVEDLISIGTIGLMKAINTFNPTKNIKLATYASRCIENEILMYLRRNNKTKLEVSIDEPLNVDWDGETNCCSRTFWEQVKILFTKTLKKKLIEVYCVKHWKHYLNENKRLSVLDLESTINSDRNSHRKKSQTF